MGKSKMIRRDGREDGRFHIEHQSKLPWCLASSDVRLQSARQLEEECARRPRHLSGVRRTMRGSCFIRSKKTVDMLST